VDDAIDTERLRLRPFASSDASSAFAWFGDPAVMRYTPTGPDKNLEETATRLAEYQHHQSDHGFSKWIILEKVSNQPIGDSGLLFLPEHGWIDFGFRLALAFWGKGLATEAGFAWVQQAFGPLKLPGLRAIVHPENTASRRVLQKLGFFEDRRDVIRGMPCLVCSLTPDQARNPLAHR